MPSITVFEHEPLTGFEPTARDWAFTRRLGAALRPEVLGGKVGLRATQFVGVVRFGIATVQILPKMHRSEAASPEERANEATRNLLRLLAYAGAAPIRESALASLLRRDSDWFEILTRLFATNLRESWRRGAIRQYRAEEETLPTLRGKLQVAAQARRPAQAHRFPVVYDSFTADNRLNRVYRFVVERLWGWTRDAENRVLLEELRQRMEEVALLPNVTAADADPALLTRLHREQEPLLNLARLFLEGGAIQLSAGKTESFAFLFDMNALFEAFLVGFLRRHRADILPSHWSGAELLPQTRGATRFLAHSDDRGLFRLQPDLAIRLGATFPLLLDAKYKRLQPTERALGVSEADVYQTLAYATRYESPRVLLLYPQTAGMSDPLNRRLQITGASIVLEAATIDLRGDLGKPSERRRLAERLSQLLREE